MLPLRAMTCTLERPQLRRPACGGVHEATRSSPGPRALVLAHSLPGAKTMARFRFGVLGILATVAAATPSEGQGPAPGKVLAGGQAAIVAEPPLSLTASDGAGLELVSMSAQVVVEDPLAFTELHLAFRNPENRVREGRFRVTL